MASFCAKCGTEIPSGQQFCTSCGMTSTAVAQPIPAPAKSGPSALKIILIIVAIVVGLGILGVGAAGFAVWRVARAIHVNGPGGQVAMQTPGGIFSANSTQSYSAEELGTDIYPGAESTRGSVKLDLPTGSMVTGVFLTSDSKSQVIDFYKSKLGSGVSVMESSEGAVLSINKGQQEAVIVTVTANSSQDNGKTRVAIVHTKSNKAS